MKHSRGEIVKCIVGSYIKRRKYSENEGVRKTELSSSKEPEKTALVAVEASIPNSVMYKWVNNDPAVAETQFSNLKTWINELPCLEAAEELKTMLFPLLCHFYLEMLSGGHKVAASLFLKKYQSVGTEEGFRILEELATLENTSDLEEKEILRLLRSSKYQVTLSSGTIQLLKQYLLRKAHVILLQIVNSWFDFEDPKTNENDPFELEVTTQANGFQEHLNAVDNDHIKQEEIIRLVNEGPATPSPLLIYSVHKTDNKMSAGVVSYDGLLLAGGFTSSEIRLWSLTDKIITNRTPCPGSVIRLAVDYPLLEDESQEPVVKIEDKPFSGIRKDECILRGHSGTVQDIVFLPESEIMVSVSMDKTMRAWDLNTFQCCSVYRGHNYPLWCVDASPLPGYVATGSHDRTARLWSLEYNSPLRLFAGHQQDVDCLRFHPNGNYLGTGSSDNTVRLWSVDTGELVRVFDGHRGGIMSLAFSPDGNFLASAGDDKKIKVWDLRTSTATEFRGHTDCILGLAWSPNGDFVASCSSDGTARLWPVTALTSEEDISGIKIYNVNNASVYSIRYSSRNTPICVVGSG